jgi:dCMP deaminase
MSDKWDMRFLALAAHISSWSKDPSSQVGAVITDGNRIVSLGYNGFAAKVKDAEERLGDRETKLQLTIHAEENAMIFAKRDLRGCTVYVTHPPCPRCASKAHPGRGRRHRLHRAERGLLVSLGGRPRALAGDV